MAETLGTRIRNVRLSTGMSQTFLAKQVGLSKQGLNMIELGKTPDPAGSRIKALAQVLKVSTDYLFGLTETR